MRLVFAGTPEFAQYALAALHEAGFDVVLVLTQPDRPAGRGLKLQPSPVKQWALDRGLPVEQPRSLRIEGSYPDDAKAARQALLAARPDAMVVAAYGLLLPPWVLELPRLGCLNIHASLLPRWRGAAPIHRAIEAGDTHTGVTIMQMDAGLDTGDMLLAQSLPIEALDTTASLHDKLAALGARLIVEALHRVADKALPATAQTEQGASYARKIDKAEAALDWNQSAAVLERRIRAFQPAPGASAQLGPTPIKIWQASVLAQAQAAAAPGTVLKADAQGVDVATGSGVLRLLVLQKPGGKPLRADEFLRGFPLQAGQSFAAQAPA